MQRSPLIPPNWQLPEAFRRRLGTSVGQQRLMQHENELLIIAHQVPEKQELQRRGILYWRDAQGEWHASSGEPGKVAIEALLDRYEKKIEEYDRLEEKAQRSDEYLPLLEGLSPIVRSARHLLDVLQDARTAAPDCLELIEARNQVYEVSRAAELLYQDAKNSMEIAVVRRAEEQAAASNRMSNSAHRLNTMAALFFPLATLGAIFGTTLTENWSWSDGPVPFLTFLISGVLAGFLLARFVNR